MAGRTYLVRSFALLSSCIVRPGRWFVLVLVGTVALQAAAVQPPRSPGGSVADEESVVLQPAALTECSGLAVSRRRADRFWLHNDSGDRAVLYAVDRSGRGTGQWQVTGADAVDWEDMASVVLDGRPQLVVADVGDNAAARNRVSLYLLDEPDPDRSGQVAVTRRIEVTYPDGPCDCEAVAVDRVARQIVLVAKTRWLSASVYGVPLDLPLSGRAGATQAAEPVVARRLTRVPMPMVTAMDIRDDDGAVVLTSYFNAFVYTPRAAGEAITTTLTGSPRHIALPRLRQIEGVCFDRDGRLWVCSEGRPGRVARLIDNDPAGRDARAAAEPAPEAGR